MDDFWPFMNLTKFELCLVDLQKEGELTPVQAMKLHSCYLNILKDDEINE